MKSRAYMVLCRMTRNALYDLIDEAQNVAVVLYRLRIDVYCGSDPTICISNEGGQPCVYGSILIRLMAIGNPLVYVGVGRSINSVR
jgi:hypothetical protein